MKGTQEKRLGSYNSLHGHASDDLTSSHWASPAECSAASQGHHGLGPWPVGGSVDPIPIGGFNRRWLLSCF